jgi:hypothetical protein
MMVSKLIPILEDGTVPLFGFDCSEGMYDAHTLGVYCTPQWVLYEYSKKRAEINPAADRDELYDFLTEQVGFSLLRPIFEMALDDGEVYAKKIRDAIVEIMFRSKDDESTIVAAARLKILKACVETPADRREECLNAQVARCTELLQERIAQPDGETEARLTALKILPSLRDSLLQELTQRKEY